MPPEILYGSYAQVLLAHLGEVDAGPSEMARSSDSRKEGEALIAGFIESSVEVPKQPGQVLRITQKIADYLVKSAAEAAALDANAPGNEMPGYWRQLQGFSDILVSEFGPDLDRYWE